MKTNLKDFTYSSTQRRYHRPAVRYMYQTAGLIGLKTFNVIWSQNEKRHLRLQ